MKLNPFPEEFQESGGMDAETFIDDFTVDYSPQEYSVDLTACCENFFAGDGILQRSAFINGRPCEKRPQQLSMALAIADALQNCRNLCIEAPTGVGKSFAYLLPLIHFAAASRRPVLVSTETINLQHQLIEKDLPFLRELSGVDFKIALAKGRSNYLCRRKLAMLSGEQRDALLPVPALAADIEQIVRALENGRDQSFNDGIRYNSSIWHMVCSESGNCAGNKCEFFRSCYYFKARRKWDEADIVVANHALFLTDLAIRSECGASGSSGALLPDYAAVMIDEAHTLENNAATHLGLRLSRAGMVRFLNRLYSPERAKGLVMRPGGEMMMLRALAQSARDEVYGFFAPYHEKMENAPNSLRLNENTPDPFPSALTDALILLEQKLDEVIENEENDSYKTEFISCRDRCREYINSISVFTQRSQRDAVYFLEKENDSVICCVSPLNVAELLQELLFENSLPVMLCSATLTVNDSFEYFTDRVGFSSGDTLKLDSPFSASQSQFIVPRDTVEPDTPEYIENLTENIRKYVGENQGSAFVLFTSYRNMYACADNLQQWCEENGFPLLVQGRGYDRSTMLNIFRETPHSVLFGADSFWTGVDVPGENLTMVIITRLPFAAPGSPLIAARQEQLEKAGLNSFFHYSLPEAVLKFRQGIGRLIRTSSDHGKIIVLDPRIYTKRYGKSFLP